MRHMFTGFGSQSIKFFQQLGEDNSKDFWTRHRNVYDESIKPTFVTLLDGVTSFGPWRVYRPNNDTRFGTSKGPYKTFIGAVAERADGVGAFIQISSKGILIGTGIPMPAPDQLTALRAALDNPVAAESFLAAMRKVEAKGVLVHGGRYEPLARVPRGFEKGHPMETFLRWKGVELNVRPQTPIWLDTPDAPKHVDRLIAQGSAMMDWLGANVGPSWLTPEERFAPKRRPT
jgi:uncharacterized protein (TIGR02453 family)